MKWTPADRFKRSFLSDCGRYVITVNGPAGDEVYAAFRVKHFPALLYTRDKAEAKRVCEEDLCGSK